MCGGGVETEIWDHWSVSNHLPAVIHLHLCSLLISVLKLPLYLFLHRQNNEKPPPLERERGMEWERERVKPSESWVQLWTTRGNPPIERHALWKHASLIEVTEPEAIHKTKPLAIYLETVWRCVMLNGSTFNNCKLWCISHANFISWTFS